MPTGAKLDKKNAYMAKLVNLVENTPQALIITVDHVGSKQLQKIRGALRGSCTILMGKNTMIRTALRKRIEETEDEGMTNLLAQINGNMGFIFCKDGTLEKARGVLKEMTVPAAAKAGAEAPKDVFIAAGNSGLEPSSTSFFQALNIPTKIVKGNIEITSDVHLIKKGDRVNLSAQALLNKLGLKPFEYGIEIRQVYQDGSVFDAAVLDITDDVIIGKFMQGVSNVAAFGREIGLPTEAGLPHMMAAAFKNILSTVLEIEFSCGEKGDEIKAILSDPEALAKMQAAAAAGATAGAATGGAAAAGGGKAAAVEEEAEEEEMDFDLFD